MQKKKKYKKRNPRSLLLKKNDDLVTDILRLLYGNVCQVCKLPRTDCGTFHIKTKKAYSTLRYAPQNLTWAGWFCCHNPWHHDYFDARDRIEPIIKQLKGPDYEDKLIKLSQQLPGLSTPVLEELNERLKKRYKQLKEEVYGVKSTDNNELPE